MRYKNAGTTHGGKIFIRKATSAFEAKPTIKSNFGTFTDHKEMKTWEHAAFQKKQYAEIKKRRTLFFIKLGVAVFVTCALVLSIPYIIDFLQTNF